MKTTDKTIYFDNAATTPVDPAVFAAMQPYFNENFANPSSIYKAGQQARAAVDSARETIAGILGCAPREIVFTSGGTESNNLFLIGAAQRYKKDGRHIVTTNIEHDSVRKPLEYLQTQGWEVTYVSVEANGIVDPQKIAAAVRPDTVMVSVIYANNEIGTIQPIKKISQAIRSFARSSILPFLHSDACQAAGFLPLSVKELGVDALTINSGKIYGPKGAGVLYLREGLQLVPQIFGGGQEHRMRSGTENVPAIVGFAKALQLVRADCEKETRRLLPLRDQLIEGILKTVPHSRFNGDPHKRLPNNVNISFKGLEGETILMRLDMLGIAASSGSACTSGSLEQSHVIQALGLPDEWTHSSTRFTLGHGNTMEDVEYVLEKLPSIIKELREVSPFV